MMRVILLVISPASTLLLQGSLPLVMVIYMLKQPVQNFSNNKVEMIIVIFWMLIGVGFYSVTIGILSSVLKNMD